MPAPSSRARRTKHKPRCPGRILQKRGQTPHSIRPSSSLVQYPTLTQSASITLSPLSSGSSLTFQYVASAARDCNEPPWRGAVRATTFRKDKREGVAVLKSEVHPAQVAGMFYPAEPDALNALIADVRLRARPDGGVAPKVVIAPHAGLVYSGAVAATAFGAWARRAERPRRIVIIGPAHRVAFQGIAVHPASKWRTPLGDIPVAGFAHAELAQAPGVAVDPRPFAGEHSLEMHLI